MERPIKIKNNYTVETFTDFADFHCKNIQGIRYFRYLGFFMIMATLWFFAKSTTMTLANLMVHPGLFISILFIGMSYWVPGNTAKQLYKKCKDNAGLENTIVFDKEKVTFTSQNMQTIYFYKQLHKCYETDKYFYVYVRRSTAQIICKNGFVDDDAKLLREFLQNEPKVKFVNKIIVSSPEKEKIA